MTDTASPEDSTNASETNSTADVVPDDVTLTQLIWRYVRYFGWGILRRLLSVCIIILTLFSFGSVLAHIVTGWGSSLGVLTALLLMNWIAARWFL
jgi:hypothetical protein